MLERSDMQFPQAASDRVESQVSFARSLVSDQDLFCLMDGRGRWKEVGEASIRHLGYRSQELLGRAFLDHVDPRDRKQARSLLGGQAHRDVELLMHRKDGSTVTLLWTLVPAGGDQIAVARDASRGQITDAWVAAMLRELEDLKLALDEHAIVAVTDAKGKITYVNDKFCAISKYSREELLGQDHRIINSAYHPKAFFKNLWNTILSGKVWKGEIRNRAKDGAHYWVDTTIVPFLGPEGVPVQFIAIRADITQKKEAEEGLRQSQKLESLGVLAGGIAHDFNNLLTSILGNANLGTLAVPLESPVLPYLEQIEKATLRAADLTRQLLAYAGKGRFAVGDVNMNRLVEEMTQLLSVSISKKVAVRYDLAPGLPFIPADPSQMQQLVMNLVTNASEAIGEEKSGFITIRTGEQFLDEVYLASMSPTMPLSPGRFVVLEVSDTGCGMSAEVQQRIFDPFFTTKFTGRGLGLSAMMGILRSHQGSVKVYSEPGKGTSFKLFLPVLNAGQNEAPASPGAGAWVGKGTILLVDDEVSARSVGRGMAHHLGFQVIEAMDGREAVMLFEQMHEQLALVVMDLTMPHMDGREAFRCMQAVNPAVPVVLSSGYSEQHVISDFVGRGLAGFLPKPYQRNQFEAVLRKALESAPRPSVP